MPRSFSLRCVPTLFLALAAGIPASAQSLTPDAWRADLRFAVDSFLARDRSFSAAGRERFRADVTALADSAGSIPDVRMIAGLARAVARDGNAHTRLYLVRNRSAVTRLPVRLWWFSDGLYVVRATPAQRALLGQRVTRVCGIPAEAAFRRMRPLYAGNLPWARYMSSYTLTSPELLAGSGLCGAGAPVRLTLTSAGGRTSEVALEPLPLRRSDQPTEAWWDLTPLHPGVQGPWESVLAADTSRLPLYLRDPLHPYWMAWLPAERVLYLQYNRAGNAAEGETLATFAERALAELARQPARKVVVDLRFNTGGNLQVAEAFMRRLAERSREKGARIFVITGAATFSAGVTHVAQLREWGGATLVGEEPGEEMEFWAEGGNLVMPNSRLTLHFADRVHRYSRIKHAQVPAELVDLDLYADRITPEIVTPLHFRDWRAGRDPAMEAIVRAR